MNIEDAKKILVSTNIFFDDDDWGEDSEMTGKCVLNMNDVWGWACADMEIVEEAELPELARLYLAYGWCGVLYWVSEKNEGMKSEFLDNNRFIDFVRNEEKLRIRIPDDSQRAYEKIEYSLGG